MCMCVRLSVCVCVRACVRVSQLMDTQLAESRKVLEKLIRKQREQVCVQGMEQLYIYVCMHVHYCYYVAQLCNGVLGVNSIFIIIIIIIIVKSTFIPSRTYPFTRM